MRRVIHPHAAKGFIYAQDCDDCRAIEQAAIAPYIRTRRAARDVMTAWNAHDGTLLVKMLDLQSVLEFWKEADEPA